MTECLACSAVSRNPVQIKENDGTHPVSAHAREQAQNQKKMIKKIRPYKNPKYRAAFILLDDID